MQTIHLVGTLDTKGAEIAFVERVLKDAGANVLVADVGTLPHVRAADIRASDIADRHPDGRDAVLGKDDRGTAVTAMGEAFAAYCSENTANIGAMIGLGGGGGTAIITAGMRQLPYGVPKVMVSTLASGDVSPYVDISDIAMFPSVTDIAGLNRLSRAILANAGHALLGMANAPPASIDGDLPAVGLSMFGVTTTSISGITECLNDKFDCIVFHATGTGGRAMERLAADEMLGGLIDITTTEICDLLFGGVLPALPTRLDVVAATGVPYVGSVGAVDMVNFWAPETVPAAHSQRKFYHHNSNVTLMRTTAEECAEVGRWIGNKLNKCSGPVRFLLPLEGISALDIEGGAFWDPDADAALFDALRSTIEQTDHRQLVELPFHINDPDFSAAAAAAFVEINPNGAGYAGN